MSVTGSFNNLGSPIVEIGVSGPLTKANQFTALADTGFSGFLLLPILEAFPVGLILRGTTTITLADGSNQGKLVCLGQVHFDGQDQVGVIVIEWQSTDVLVGMDFLKKFGRKLLVDPINGKVELTDAIPAITGSPSVNPPTTPIQ